MAKHKIKPVHPGRILFEEFMEPADISQYRLANATGLSRVQVRNTVRGKRRISAETALRLECALGMSAQTWMNLQMLHDLEETTLKSGSEITRTTERLNLTLSA
jgi:addiction module HigA family antidote